jgi:hypothetical protein
MKYCKYYFDLEEKFVCRSAMVPKNTSDQLFGIRNSGEDDDSIFDVMGEEEQEAEDSHGGPNIPSVAATPSAAKSRKKKSTSSSGRKGKRGKSEHTAQDTIDHMIASLCKDAVEKNKCQNTNVVQMVELTENFKRMSDALGSKIKAAYQCKEFYVLLDKKEKKQLKQYTREQEEDSSDEDGSDSNSHNS